MPRQDIANYLGLAVETVSRLFAHFQETGLINVDRRRINILDLDRLRNIVSGGKGDEARTSVAK
jgi:CRP/FNR family transcriptional regulator